MSAPPTRAATTVWVPFGARLTDASTLPLDLLEDYYRGCIYEYNERDWFNICTIKRLYAENRRLNCLLDCKEAQAAGDQHNHEILAAMAKLDSSKLRPDRGDRKKVTPVVSRAAITTDACAGLCPPEEKEALQKGPAVRVMKHPPPPTDPTMTLRPKKRPAKESPLNRETS